jgi:hypothetical protein
MRKIKKIYEFKNNAVMKITVMLFFIIAFSIPVLAQNDPVLSIDGVNTTFKSGLSLPYWLTEGHSVGLISNVKSVSVLEFTIDSTNLKFSNGVIVTGSQTVPLGKIWKIEALGLGVSGQTTGGFSTSTIPSIFTSPKIFSSAGTFSWIVPPGVTNICVEVWGGGGSGGTSNMNTYMSGGGGGGGYGYQCFSLVSGTSYIITVGGIAGATSVGNLINATGGTNGANGNTSSAAGGVGGISSALFNIAGVNGRSGSTGGNGGNGGNGGSGGTGNPNVCGVGGNGNAPGGGGGNNQGNCSGGGGHGFGASGQVIIYW